MQFKKFAVLFVSSLVAISSSFAAPREYGTNIKHQAIAVDTQNQDNKTNPINITRNDSAYDWNKAEIDGIALKYLTEEELKDLLDDEDNMIASELDIIVAKKLVNARKMDAVAEMNSTHSKHRQRRFLAAVVKVAQKVIQHFRKIPKPRVIYVDNRHKRDISTRLFPSIPSLIQCRNPKADKGKKAPQQNTSGQTRRRGKRWVGGLARLLSAGRNLFKGAARAPKPTVSGNRVTQQYTRPGNFNDAVRDFNQFRPDNLRNFNKNGISGQTGTVGPHRFTVRDGSKQGSPTLEIRSPRTNGEHVRKFRYNQK